MKARLTLPEQSPKGDSEQLPKRDPEQPTQGDHPMKIRLNSWTRLYPCRFLEWTGWYSVSVSQRLIGHYRLFQHYKVYNAKWPNRDYSATAAYILQYKATQGFKYFVCRIISFCCTILSKKQYYLGVEVAGINRRLIDESPAILQEFLVNADTDFNGAMTRALQQINDPSFLNHTVTPAGPVFPSMMVQFNQENNNYTTNNHQYNYSKVNIQPVIKEGAKGKEKGVFSKKQILIMFDLLAESARMEKIDFSKPNKFDGLADLFHALTGKTKESFIELLNNYKTRSLYEFNTPGELNQLLIILNNLADTFRKAGFRSVSKLADRKILELESMRKD